jgi:hypothetical protein
MRLASHSALLGVALSLAGCFPPGEGIEPPRDRVYFPTGVALTGDRNVLLVANSDFDLQFNGGTLQTFDVGSARDEYWNAALAGDCGSLGTQPAYRRSQVPGLCNAVAPDLPLPSSGTTPLRASVGIGAFATDLVLASRPADAVEGPPMRAFIPVRGDTTVHWADVNEDGTVECGQAGASGSCDDVHRRGDDPDEENSRELELPTEPFGIAATGDARALVVTHQTEGKASLFTHDWSEQGPLLQFVSGDMPARAVGVAAVPAPAAASLGTPEFDNYAPGFLVTFRNAPEVRLLRYFPDAGATPTRPFLQPAGTVDVRANALNFDSRGVATDDSKRLACESSCAGDTACLLECSKVPVAVYVANRSPASLLVGETRVADRESRAAELPTFHDSVPLPFGPSRVVVGDVKVSDTATERRVFVICFDARRIVVYDPVRRREETWIDTGRGPHALAIDPVNGIGYVAHFTDSYIGLIDLNQQNTNTYGKIVLSFGIPTEPRASK